MALSITLPTVGGDENTWGTKTNNALTTILNGVNGTSGTVAPNLSTLTINSVNVTATAAELNKLAGTPAGLTSTELGYVDGVTSSIQTQLNAKQATITGGATTIDTENLTASRALISNGSGKVVVSGVTSTELNVLDGGTAATSTTVAAADRVVFNDNGTMKQVSMSDIATYTSAQVSSPTVNDATITITAGNALTGGGNFTTDQASNETITINHQDTSTQSSVNNSGSTYIQDITLDTYGHVTAITSTDAASNISSNGFVTGARLASTGGTSTTRTFSTAITVQNGQTIHGWSSHEANPHVNFKSNYQGNINSLTDYGNPFNNTSGSAVTVYAHCSTTGSAARGVTYQIFG